MASVLNLSSITPLILTRNEAPNLARTLARLSWAREVIVLDSGSTDATRAIAGGFANVRWLERPFDGHAAQWNHGLDAVGTDWVLSLDADYVLGAGFEDELAALAERPAADAWFAGFRYLVAGRPLRASLYPPRAVLFRRDRCRYVQDGHTQRLVIPGATGELRTRIDHDDRKPLGHWLAAQDRYAQLEADKLLAADPAHLRPQDRLRLSLWAAPLASLGVTLFVKGVILDGWRGWYYALQRLLAEVLLLLRLLERTRLS